MTSESHPKQGKEGQIPEAMEEEAEENEFLEADLEKADGIRRPRGGGRRCLRWS